MRTAGRHRSLLRVAAVNIDDTPDLYKKYNIKTLPHIMIFDDKKNPIVYTGEKKADNMIEKLKSFISTDHLTHVHEMNEMSVRRWVLKNLALKIVLITDKKRLDIPLLWRAFSKKYSSKNVEFGIVCRARGLMLTQQLITSKAPKFEFPQVWAIQEDGSRTKFEGETNMKGLVNWLKKMKGDVKSKRDAKNDADAASGAAGEADDEAASEAEAEAAE